MTLGNRLVVKFTSNKEIHKWFMMMFCLILSYFEVFTEQALWANTQELGHLCCLCLKS